MNELTEFFKARRRFVLTTHMNPDGDAIGSEMALALWLRAIGKTVHIINHNSTPFVYRFLDPDETTLVFDPVRDAGTLQNADAIVVLDTNHLSRIASMEQLVRSSPAKKICIDHHLDPEPFSDIALIISDATSTGEILFSLLRPEHQGTLPRNIAEALYVAVMTDTGSFRYPRVGVATHQMVAELIRSGADPVELYGQVYNRWSLGRMRLLGEMLSTMETAHNGRLAYVTVTQDMLRRTGTLEEDTDNFTTYPMSIEGVIAGILFVELQSGFKISFRSHGDVPINELAQEFGGNGHKNAAGARIANNCLTEVRSSVLAAAQKYLSSRR
jgi:phosphoesterase RecJ-like protein